MNIISCAPIGLSIITGLAYWIAGWLGIAFVYIVPLILPVQYFRHSWGQTVVQYLFKEIIHDVIITKAPEYINLSTNNSDGDGDGNGDGDGCILAWTPHGIVPTTMITNPHPRSVIAVASIVYYLPFFYFLLSTFVGGVIPATETAIRQGISKGCYVNICPGGIQEIIQSIKGSIYKRHKGFARIAFQTNTPLVPVVVLNEIDRVHDLVPACITRWSYRLAGIPFMSPYIDSKKGAPPVHIIYDAPLFPANFASYEDLHAAYYQRVDDICIAHS